MTRGRTRAKSALPIAALILASFCAGVLVDWRLRAYGPPKPVQALAEALVTGEPNVIEPIIAAAPPPLATRPGNEPAPFASLSLPSVESDTPAATTGILPALELRLPIDGMHIESSKGGFLEHRGARPHEAIDVLAPRNTPVHAVTTGTIAKLFLSKPGGNTIYQFDAEGRFCYYYAHLERYADGLHEGQVVAQGDVIGFVGTSGNAPPETPHLHFAVFELNANRQWWRGRAIDPYLMLRQADKGQ